MRQTDKDEVQGLGKKIERPPMPERHKRVSEHVWQAPDGKLYTEDMTPPPIVDIYTYLGLPRGRCESMDLVMDKIHTILRPK